MKKSIGLLLLLAANTNFAASNELHIGDYYNGGVIFWLDPSNQHGLIADIKDAPNKKGYAWDTKPPSDTNARAEKPFDGRANTQTIVAAIGPARAQAANTCITSNNQGYSDWYLPAKTELAQLLPRQTMVTKTAKAHKGASFSNSPYWSSTEYRMNSAWNVSNLSTGGTQDGTYRKNITLNVRCIRSF